MIDTPQTAIIIVIDSVRYYRSGADDRDRLDVMDKYFGKDSVEFTNAYTSAPSSVMSAAAMFTGMDSCFLARNYNDWEFDNSNVISLQQILIDHGYEIYTIDNSRVGREIKKDLTLPIHKKFYPKGISHGNFWTNLELTKILENVLNTGVSKKSLFMLWYDCRNDPNTSIAVERALDLFKKFELYDESVIFMNSDHGYPDPSSGLNKNTMRNMRHDMVVTDDNIKVPLFVKAPNISPHKNDSIVSLTDITPTILDLLEIKHKDKRLENISGQSLKNQLYKESSVEPDNRIVRSDTRLLLQKGRITALRDKKFKYVIYHDENKQELFDMINDPEELSPLDLGKFSKKVNIFNEIFVNQQNKINNFHIEDLKERVIHLNNLITRKKIKNIILMTEAPILIIETLLNSLKKDNPILSIDFACKELRNELDGLFNKQYLINDKDKHYQKYDLAIIINEKSHYNFDDPTFYNFASKNSFRAINLDYNLKIYSRFMAKWIYPVIKYRKNWHFYKQEPKLFFMDIWKLIRLGVKVHILKDKTQNPDMQIVKQLRDRSIAAIKEKDEISNSKN